MPLNFDGVVCICHKNLRSCVKEDTTSSETSLFVGVVYAQVSFLVSISNMSRDSVIAMNYSLIKIKPFVGGVPTCALAVVQVNTGFLN